MGTKSTLHERTVPQSLSTRVCLALAEEDDVHPWESPPLYETIDPSLLEALETRTDREWRLEFEVESHTVAVTSDGTVSVDGVRFSDRDLRAALDALDDREYFPRRTDSS